MRRTISMLSWDLLRLSQMSSWVWFAFTEISVEAGRNNESREPRACRLGPFRTAVQLPAERVVKAPSVAMRRARVIRSGDAS